MTPDAGRPKARRLLMSARGLVCGLIGHDACVHRIKIFRGYKADPQAKCVLCGRRFEMES